MDSPRRTLKDLFVGYVKELRFPWLLAVTAAIFFLDLVIPDFIPFADEIVLGLVTAILATLKRKRRDRLPASLPAGEESRRSTSATPK